MMHYVYVYRDPRAHKNNTPIYVGKGSGRRAFDRRISPEKSNNKKLKILLNLLRREGLEPNIEVMFEFETAHEALAKEIELIALFGREDLGTGPLFNCTKGGEGTAHSIETKELIGKTSVDHWQDPEYREKCVDSMKISNQTPAQKERRGNATKAGWADEETRRKRTEGIQAAQTPEMHARRSASNKAGWTDEKRAAFSAQMLLQSKDPEVKKNRAEAAKKAWAKRKSIVV